MLLDFKFEIRFGDLGNMIHWIVSGFGEPLWRTMLSQLVGRFAYTDLQLGIPRDRKKVRSRQEGNLPKRQIDSCVGVKDQRAS